MSTNKVQVMYELLAILAALTAYSVYREVKLAPVVADDETLEQIAYEPFKDDVSTVQVIETIKQLQWAELLVSYLDKANMVTVRDPLIGELYDTAADTDVNTGTVH